MNEEERKKQDELEASGLAERLRVLVMSFCAPLWWVVNKNTVLGNGTMCVLQTADGLFGVTANHVLTVYERHRAQHEDVFCQLGSGPFEPTENIIDRSEHWDLASFRIPEFTLRNWGKHHNVYPAHVWPPEPLKKGDPIILGGFPENRRSQSPGHRPKLLHTDFVSFRAIAENWSDEHMSFCFDSNSWYWPAGQALEPHPNLSGASGGPCFRMVPAGSRIELTGFIYEAHTEFEVIRVRQASLLLSDGRISPVPFGV